ncbi:MAG: hypothetical protein NWF01_01620 [Candidatus Bathyarchaeota archaeon]|nr:hypothetical protein [Candidatus Bathyarchaeota archaeon]
MKLATLLLCFALLATLSPALIANAEQQTGDTWETKTPIPQTGDMKAVAVEDKIYVFQDSSTYMYDPATDAWTQKTAMPTPRGKFFAATAINTTIYTIGEGVNEAYNTLTDTWETKQVPPYYARVMGASVVDGKIYVIGGAGQGNNQNQVYDPATNSWTPLAPMPTGFGYYFITTCLDKQIYFILSDGTNLIYDTTTDTWTTGATIPQKYSESVIAATTGQYVPERIYVIGGCIVHGLAQTTAVNSTFCHDPVSDVWSQMADAPTRRSSCAVAVVDDKIYVIGGSLDVSTLTGNPTNIVEVYTPAGYSTAQPSGDNSPQPSPVENLSLIVGSVVATAIVTVAAITVYHFKHTPNKTPIK